MPPPFLRFEQLLLPPPLAALSGLLLAIGIAGLGIAGARALRGSRFEALDGAAGVVLSAALLGAALHAVALLGLLRLWPLRILAGFLAAAGAVTAARHGPSLLRRLRILSDHWWQCPLLDRALAILLGLTALGLFLAALGPACDGDSIDYHLSVPLDWLRHGGAEPRPDWFLARLIGTGEMLDLLGLGGGSDSLGAMLQWTGAILAALAVSTFAHRDRDRLIAIGLVLASPVLLSLVPAQKPQLLPAAASGLALVLIVRRWNDLDRSTLVLAFAAAAFAMSCKYSFLISGAMVIAAGLLAARRTRPGFALATAVGAVLLIAAPVYLRNLAFYGDPLSPFLERFRSSPSAALVDFAAFYRAHAGSRDPLGILGVFAVALAGWPITGALGIGALSPLLAGWHKSSARRLLVVAAATTALDLAFSDLTPRFFLEPFFWGIAAIGLRERPVATGWVALVSAQAAVSAAGAAICTALLFPGCWSGAWRDRVLRAHAPGYLEARWLDEVLRPEDVLLMAGDSHFFLPRPFIAEDAFDGSRPEAVERQELRLLELDGGLSVMAVRSDDELSPAITEAAQQAEPIDGVHSFPAGTRNPLVHFPDVEVRALRLRR